MELNILYAGTSKSWHSSVEFCWWHIKFVLIYIAFQWMYIVWSDPQSAKEGGYDNWSFFEQIGEVNQCRICLIVELVKTGVIWDTASCWLVNSCQHFWSTTFFWDVSNYASGNSETSQKAWIFKLINAHEHASKLDRTGNVPTLCSTKIKRPKIFQVPNQKSCDIQ